MLLIIHTPKHNFSLIPMQTFRHHALSANEVINTQADDSPDDE